MKAVIDTNSLLSLVRYYSPFDKQNILYEMIKTNIANGEILIIDKIIEECNRLKKGIIVTTLSFLTDKEFNKAHKLPFNTESLLPPTGNKFYNMVDNNFVNKPIKNKLDEIEYESRKEYFMKSADMGLVLTCLNLKMDYPTDDIFLVTEETEINNDNKLFVKIPKMCDMLDIQVMNIPQLIDKLKIGINFTK
jgi:hypothetical protein